VSALLALLTELRLTTKAMAGLPNSGLYQLIRQPKPIAERQFEIEFLDSDVEALRSRSADSRQRLFNLP